MADEPDAALIEELAAFQTRVRQEFVGAFPGLSSDEIDLLLGFIVPSLTGGSSGLSFFGGVSTFTLSRGRNADLSITQLLSTGATLQLAYAFTRQFSDPASNRLNPLYTHALTLTLAQPLLRGFGPAVTNADIHIAQLDRNASAADFETQVQNQIRQGLDLYWDLVFEVKRYDVQLISYTAALDLLRINEARFEVGDLAFPEVLQARASVEARREQVIRARQRVRDAEDRLKQLMFFQDETPAWELELLPTQELTWREIEFDPEQVLAEAIRERPEIRSRLSRIDRSDLELLKARDQIKPALDLVGSAGAAGLASGGNRAFDVLERVDFNSLSIGLEFSFPLQNRRARFTHKQRAAEKDRALEEYLREVDIVTSDVRFAIRELRTTRERIDITRSRVESEQLNVDAARQRYNVGFVAQFEVLEFQEDLATAQEAHVQAIVDYNKADIALERARGTILQTYGIVFEAPAFRPRREPVVFPIGFD
ncbi:TolC family protein [Candidatus Sumerlaeota bacterium]|nr:TolC family protein [Candidatus Sumerlaeota bacterium]